MVGEIKPGDDRRAVNGLFLSLPLSPSPSPRLYSRSPRVPWLITWLRDRRGHRGIAGRAARPHPGGWELVPPPHPPCVGLSPPDPPEMVFFKWQFHDNLMKLFISTIAPTCRSWKENGPTASSPGWGPEGHQVEGTHVGVSIPWS